MSDAVVAPCGTAAPDWVLVVATSDGDGVGETGRAITACCCGCGLVWLESAAMRADAPPGSTEADRVLRLADAVFVFTGALGSGAGILFAEPGVLPMAARMLLGSVVAALAALVASAACCGAGAAAGVTASGAGWLLAIVTGLVDEP